VKISPGPEFSAYPIASAGVGFASHNASNPLPLENPTAKQSLP
jgi:hypothetical protein